MKDFDAQYFSPDIWDKMAGFMRDISGSYLQRAVEIARLMQHAYNYEFELQPARKYIRPDYSTAGVTMKDGTQVLAADVLLLDIDLFSYDLATALKAKQAPVKQTISLATSYPYLFETQFRRTGRLDFETTFEQFDLAYPGTYQGRIEAVEVEVEGLLPPEGLRGTFGNSGVSRYRSLVGPDPVKYRFQPADTMVLSEYRTKQDAFVYPAEPNRLKLFQGAGVVASWTIDIPPLVNNLDYNTITDIRVTFYYQALYDAVLAGLVKQDLKNKALVPASHTRALPLRWAFPDGFFALQDTGEIDFTLTYLDFPCNELKPVISSVGLLLAVDGADPSSWRVSLQVPHKSQAIAAQPDAHGQISQPAGNQPWVWAPLAGGSALGPYRLRIDPAIVPPTLPQGWMKTWANDNLLKLQNAVLILEYKFTPRESLP